VKRAAARDDTSLERHPGYLFPEMGNPQVAPGDWHPTLPDCVHFSFSNGTAFSATDVIPLSHGAKVLMMVPGGIEPHDESVALARHRLREPAHSGKSDRTRRGPGCAARRLEDDTQLDPQRRHGQQRSPCRVESAGDQHSA
jgi:hypothetical protein